MKVNLNFNAIIFFLLIGIFTSGCQGEPKDQPEGETAAESTGTIENEAPQRLPQVNDGPEMPHCAAAMRGIESMLALVDKAQKNPEATGLKELLQMEYESILKRCPDSNPAYQALHAYLPALKELIDELSDPAEPASLEILESYLLQYYELFG